MNEPEINADFESFLAQWQLPTRTADAQDWQHAVNAVETLYAATRRDKPAIVCCDSFYQMLTIPSLIYAILHSDLWHVMSEQLLQLAEAGKENWWKNWDEVFPELWINCGEPIFRGMNATSRVHEYIHLKDSLIDQVRRELGRNLQQDRLKAVHVTLKREIYRRFWMSPLHEVGAEMFAETAETELSDVGQTRLLKLGQAGISRFQETMINAVDLGATVDQNFNALCLRFGAEPALQGSRTFWFAHHIPLLAAYEYFDSTEYGAQVQYQPAGSGARLWLDIARVCSGVLLLNGVAFLCTKPLKFDMDEFLQLHSATGPALTYADGFTEYAWHGAFVSRAIIEQPESITVGQIENEQNVEIRRVLLERFGEAEYLQQSGMTPVHEDEFGILYKKEFVGDEPLTIVKVANSTPEPDGSIKHYYLRVPPDIQTAQQAVAWTFGFDDHLNYNPSVQT